MPHPRLIGAGAILLALAAAAVLWPRETAAPLESPSGAAEPQQQLRLEHRLEDAGARLVRSVNGEQTRRLDRPVALLGGAVSEVAPDFVRLQIHSPDGSDSHCAGGLFAGGWILTAAHCLDDPFLWIDASIGPQNR